MASITVRAFAKINLGLCIKDARADGFHDLQTIFQTIDLHDRLTLEARRGPFEIRCQVPGVPTDRTNLVWKAAQQLWAAAGRDGDAHGAIVTLDKHIPMQAGLGGGSSDAAAALYGLNRLWGLELTVETLCGLGREIGSDIPFFLGGPTAAGYGRGDELIRLSNETDYWYLLVNPGIMISTAWVYSQVDISADDIRCNRPPLDSENWIGPLVQPNLELTKEVVHIKIFLPDGLRLDGNNIWLFPYNDLEGVVIRRYPVIKKIKDEMVASGAMCALMSGSGSSVFGVFRDRDSAERAGRNMQHYEWRTWIVKALDSCPYHIVS